MSNPGLALVASAASCSDVVWYFATNERWLSGNCANHSIAQVSGTYGHAEAQTIVENCGNTLILRCSSSKSGGTARFANKLIGEREITREHVTTNDGGGMFSRGHASTNKSLQHVTEAAVLPSEIEHPRRGSSNDRVPQN